jgi:hypothetical protein
MKAQSFKQKYKLQGMIAAVALMWADYALIHYGLTSSAPELVSAGMGLMFGAAILAYYFG